MSRSPSALPVVLGVVLAAGCSLAAPQVAPTMSEQHTEAVTATVESVDPDTREVRIRTLAGEELRFVASAGVRTLGQLAVGDTVLVEYTESISVELHRADGSEPRFMIVTGGVGSEAFGEPRARSGRELGLTAVIVAIDKPNRRLVIQGPSGRMRILQVADARKLEGLRLGDLVALRHAEVLGIAVEKDEP